MAAHARLLRIAGEELHPSRLLPSLAAGLVNGVLVIFLTTSFAALIFSGNLAPFFPTAVGVALFGAMVLGIIVVFLSSFAGTVTMVQDVPAAILAVVDDPRSFPAACSYYEDGRMHTAMGRAGLPCNGK